MQQHLEHVPMSFGSNVSSINISHPLASTLTIFWQQHPLAKTSQATTSSGNNYLNNIFATNIVFTIFVVFSSSKPSTIKIIYVIFIVNIISTYHLCCLYNKHHFYNLYCLCNKHHLYNQHINFVVFITNIIFTSNISCHHYNHLVGNGGYGCNEQFKQQFDKQCKKKRQR